MISNNEKKYNLIALYKALPKKDTTDCFYMGELEEDKVELRFCDWSGYPYLEDTTEGCYMRAVSINELGQLDRYQLNWDYGIADTDYGFLTSYFGDTAMYLWILENVSDTDYKQEYNKFVVEFFEAIEEQNEMEDIYSLFASSGISSHALWAVIKAYGCCFEFRSDEFKNLERLMNSKQVVNISLALSMIIR